MHFLGNEMSRAPNFFREKKLVAYINQHGTISIIHCEDLIVEATLLAGWCKCFLGYTK
jgi:hypothetical protein